jgi:hypothetical protein
MGKVRYGRSRRRRIRFSVGLLLTLALLLAAAAWYSVAHALEPGMMGDTYEPGGQGSLDV